MKSTIYIDTYNKTAGTSETAIGWTPPRVVFGETLTLALRWATNEVETQLDAQRVSVAVGALDARPEAGHIRLLVQVDSDVISTGTIPLPLSSTAIKSALEAKSAITTEYGSVTVWEADGSFILRFGDGSVNVPLEVDAENLWPVSFGRVFANQQDGIWRTEIRLTQAPVAWGSTQERVLPKPPTMTRVRAGGADGPLYWNEVQALFVPHDFRGTYQLKLGVARSGLISQEDGATQIEEALSVIKQDGFSITNPATQTAHIEFSHEDYQGLPQSLLEVEVTSHPVGDFTLDIEFNKAPLVAMLRRSTEVTLPFEITVLEEVSNNGIDIVLKPRKVYRSEITIVRDVDFEELALTPQIDWLRPPSPRDYKPFTTDQIITGNQHYVTPLGDGTSMSFVVDHALATRNLHVALRHNAGALQLIPESEYEVILTSENSITINFSTAPEADEFVLTVTAAGPTSVFLNHTHTIAQIEGLAAKIETLEGRLETLESLLPTSTPGVAVAERLEPIDILIAPLTEIYPGRFPADFALSENLEDVDASALPRVPGLLPAINTSGASAVASLTINPSVGDVIEATAPIQLFGARGRRGSIVQIGEHVAWDGRMWYKVQQEGALNTWHPSDFERELFLFHVDPAMLRVGKTLELQVALQTRLFSTDKRRKTRGHWMFQLEFGTIERETNPSTTGANIKSITWAAPSLEHRLILTDTLQMHRFGVRVKRTPSEITCDTMLYDYWTGGATAPSTADFVARARLTRFDTEDGLSDPSGFVGLAMLTGSDETTYARII